MVEASLNKDVGLITEHNKKLPADNDVFTSIYRAMA